MQRYFLQSTFHPHGEASIIGDDARHIQRVMRMAIGDEIIAVAENKAYKAKVIRLEEQTVYIERQGEQLPTNEMPVHITIACGLPKGDKLDLIVQKATELGVHQIVPFEAERSIVKWDAKKGVKKVERLQKIAKEAAEQSHRSIIPHVNDPVSFKQLIELATSYHCRFVADEEEAKENERKTLSERLTNIEHGQMVLAVFGPEGGLSRKEVDVLHAAGFESIALGPRILRTETAPLYFLSAVSYELE